MNKIFKTLLTAVAMAGAMTMSITASAYNSYESSQTSYTKTVSASDTTYVHQSTVNSFEPGTYIVLNSDYTYSTDTYSIAAYYGCRGDEYPYRFARVRALNSSGTALQNKYNYKTADDVVASAYVDNANYSTNIAKVDFFGKSTLYNSIALGLSGGCQMTCELTLT